MRRLIKDLELAMKCLEIESHGNNDENILFKIYKSLQNMKKSIG